MFTFIPDRQLEKTWVQLLCLFVLIFAAYFPVLIAPQTVNPDATVIVGSFHSDYFKNLFSLKAVDFQPVRDASLYLDWVLFQRFQINTFIWQNALWWLLSCFVVFQLLLKIFPLQNSKKLFLFTCLFAVYPLFSASVSWGMARKHILSFFFILCAMNQLFSYLQTSKRKSLWLMKLFYFLAIFSQPISLLWPVWLVSYLWLFHRARLNDFRPTMIALLIIFIAGFAANFLYYRNSDVFSYLYASKTSDAFALADKILAFGHYMFQLFFPYQQAFYYDLAHWSVWVGIMLAGLLYLFCSSIKFSRQELFCWSLFALLPLMMVLNSPHTKFDTYLLLPAFALLVLLLKFDQKLNFNVNYLLPLIAIWIVVTHLQANAWTDREKFWELNFERRPTCIGGVQLSKTKYTHEKSPSAEVVSFMAANRCLVSNTQLEQNQFVVLQTQSLYYDGQVSPEKRMELLEKLSQHHFYPKLVLAALQIQQGRKSEALKHIHDLVPLRLETLTGNNYSPIVHKVVHPFCLEQNDADCLKISTVFSRQKPTPFL